MVLGSSCNSCNVRTVRAVFISNGPNDRAGLDRLLEGRCEVARASDIFAPTCTDAGLPVNRLRAVLHPRPQAVKQSS